MKKIAKTASMLALAMSIAPAFLFFADRLPLSQAKMWMLLSAALWFCTVPIWMERK
jgi:hypothetical protein